MHPSPSAPTVKLPTERGVDRAAMGSRLADRVGGVLRVQYVRGQRLVREHDTLRQRGRAGGVDHQRGVVILRVGEDRVVAAQRAQVVDGLEAVSGEVEGVGVLDLRDVRANLREQRLVAL